VSGSGAAMKFLDVVRATLRTIFRPRFELRVPPFFFDLRFVAKSFADYAECDGFGKAKFNFRFSGSFPETRKQALFADCAKYLGKLPR
jgi:hypothetical protein